MRSRLQLASLVLGAALACNAFAKEQINEESLEASAAMLSMPAVADGVLVVKTCNECEAKSLRASPITRYVLGGKNVSLKDLSDYVRSHGKAFASVNYDAKTRALNRISVSPR